MKFSLNLILLLVLSPVFALVTVAEDKESKLDAAQTAESLRLQLIDVKAQEAELQARAHQLEENMKPENIERSLAGVGSTKPEALREFRQRQIAIELEGVRKQLGILSASRERLEAAIRRADTAAYHQSAEGTVVPTAQALKADGSSSNRRYFLALASVGVLGLIVLALVLRRAKQIH